MRLWLPTGESRGTMSASWAPCTQVWAPLAGRRQNQSLWFTTTARSMTRTSRTRCAGESVKGGTRRWPVSSITSSTWLGSMSASYSRNTSSRRARRKVLQQLAEELRAEYMEGKGAAAVGTRWAAAEATTAAAAAAADTDTEAVPVRKSCKQNQTSDTWNATSPCVVTDQWSQRLFVFVLDQLVSGFFDYYYY